MAENTAARNYEGHQQPDAGSDHELREYPFKGFLFSGFAMIAVVVVLIGLLIWGLIASFNCGSDFWGVACAILLGFVFVFGLKGYITQEPNEARVMIFFGKYVGTCRKVGFFWANPFLTKNRISLRIRNIDIDPIKVNDKVGNPVLIGMVLVWKIRDTYRSVFDVETTATSLGARDGGALVSFVRIQSDAALREVTSQYAYDDDPHGGLTLRSGSHEISGLLEKKINERVAMAGIEVVEARINYLAYAPEIAAVMLRRQQAAAIIAAREKIVEGAVSMVKMAIDRITADKVATFTPEAKAAMVSNLLVVLCSDEPARPVLNAGD